MRKIKFRIWYCGKMRYPHLQETFIGRANVIHMQFTGLLDKVGKEIYEGDILKHTDKEDGEDFGNGEVVFSKGRYMVKEFSPKTTWLCSIDQDDDVECEIIGNMYENKDLLNANKGKEAI